jgi:hypothetical protein
MTSPREYYQQEHWSEGLKIGHGEHQYETQQALSEAIHSTGSTEVGERGLRVDANIHSAAAAVLG